MKLPNPLTGVPGQTPVRTGGATGRVGSFGETRVGADGHTPKMHKGIDLLAEPGQHVFAAHDGVIARAGWEDPKNHAIGYGQRVTIFGHGTLETRYAHLSWIGVKSGDPVEEGAIIGRVGRTGNVEADAPTHLHFEVRLDGNPIDPYEVIA